MSDREDSDIDDDFSDLYKEYTGPQKSITTSVPETTKTSKRSHADSDEEQETLDPNAVPTDFTSRDAKVWEAKSKATERNWKKRKEEEMICKLCGDSSHYTQGCPSTLGASRKSQDLFERVPARDPKVKALFTDRVVKEIEKDIGCKIRIEEKFIIVSGKDGKTLSKGVDAVFKIKSEGSKTGESNSNMRESNSRSPKGRHPVVSKVGPADSQRSNPSPRHPSNYDQRPGRQDKVIKEHVREEFQKYPRGSPQAYGNDGIHIRSTHSKSPARRPPYPGGSYDSKDNHKYGTGPGPGPISQPTHSTFSLALEELELEYKRDAMDIAKIRDKAEDEENYRHRQAVEQIRGNYMERLATIREVHAKQWEQFLKLETRKRQQESRQQMSNVGFGGYRNDNRYDYAAAAAAAAANPYVNNMPMESRLRYPEIENNPSLRSNNYDFQRARHGDHGEAYNRY